MIYYVTGNKDKFNSAKIQLKKHGIDVRQKIIHIKEIQSDSIKEIALDKAKKTFEIVNKPLLVNDSGWYITALNGFPGPFMAFVNKNKWLASDDFIKLMKGKKNREVILKQLTVYIDSKKTKIFEHDSIGRILNKPQGKHTRPIDTIASFSKEGLSITKERQVRGDANFEQEISLWKAVAKWLKKNDKS